MQENNKIFLLSKHFYSILYMETTAKIHVYTYNFVWFGSSLINQLPYFMVE